VCPHCQHSLQFKPFFAAAEDYAEILRRGLEQSRREKGADHEEMLAHLSMWRPMEIYLSEWWPLRRRKRVFEKLSLMPVEIAVQKPG
jgi:hypothetical protein